MKMTIPYNLTGKQRKQLAEDISVALHTIPKYLGYPTCNYQIGDCILERNGKLIIPESVANETATVLLEHLRSRGYVGEAVETEDRLTISMPRELFSDAEIEILQQIVTAKAQLLKKAFLAESLEAMVTDTTISFSWFPFTAEPDEVNAYSTFVADVDGWQFPGLQHEPQSVFRQKPRPGYLAHCHHVRLFLFHWLSPPLQVSSRPACASNHRCTA